MTTLGPEDVECTILTLREGVLSPIGHDLKLRAERLSVEIDEGFERAEAVVDARSIIVVAAMHGDEEIRSGVSASDRRDIEARMLKEVLVVARHPEIRFASSSIERRDDGATVTGELTLHGVTRTIRLDFRHETSAALPEPVYRADVRLKQTDFDIAPYRAMLGALRVRDEVVVRVLVRAAAIAPR